MASFGKKILSAFMEVEGEKKNTPQAGVDPALKAGGAGGSGASGSVGSGAGESVASPVVRAATDQRFADYFDKLFGEANIPGPDYYEFARMIGAMQAIPDERSRYVAAFAGLQVQGLGKEKLLSTASEYLRVVAADADRFGKTVESALQEKVHSRAAEAEEKGRQIQVLSQQIVVLQAQISSMQGEIRESKERLEANNGAYAAESDRRKRQIETDIEKINNYIH